MQTVQVPWNEWLPQIAATAAHKQIELLSVLGKLTELRDPQAAGHNLRVTLYTLMFAEALGLSPKALVRATKGAFLHDIGKLVVPEHILEKPGPLTGSEREVMKTHVHHGVNLVRQAQALHEAEEVVAAHHERYDGSGYPAGLKGGQIPFEARVFALVDVFDALASRRVYKEAFSVRDALLNMDSERGSHFDPQLLDRFVRLAPSFAERMPTDEPALAARLQAGLWPYLEHFT